MDNIHFYHPISAKSSLPNAPAQRPILTAHGTSSLSYPSQQLTHPLPSRPSPSVTLPLLLKEISMISSSDGSEPPNGKQINLDDHSTRCTGSELNDSFDDRLGIPIKADTAEASTPEACQSGGSRDDPIVIDDPMGFHPVDGPAKESVDALVPPPFSPIDEASVDEGDEPDQSVDGSTASTPREISETPPLTTGESASSRDTHTRVSPNAQGRPPSTPVKHGGVTREEWPVKKILNFRIRVRGGRGIQEYRIAWKPTWQPRSDLVPGCEELIEEFHAKWKDERLSLTSLVGYRQKRRSCEGSRRKVVKSSH
ncbi:hypothetical protein PAAG_09011 [Paracoccidioides lutzii Pb01]|uniref:Chromo domain-containing protein n=1 Tax=Paracoccidioides lutzii (strain ATCC MYA-826 / Pb01) TaxID=502779 RepID=C1HE18_PARBA|nr:hypothetical protein PAAG_09011 [Paracoccidioides lutzii Pb01]EEH40558.2 hypothetical protein PAAG_09011 [Paracoccidioides lutzii Pb01]